MISGATLIGYRDRYDTKTYFKHRIKRCFIPYLIYSIGGMIAFFIINKTPGPDIPIKIFDLLFLGQQLNY
ncbi:MAG: hypothetical protein MJ195_02075 [Mycoplasmoidaceae bacterium]|nr:hypothetical protein [Mycoplasmoidaceae bacterium]